jgi:hypothetical protein
MGRKRYEKQLKVIMPLLNYDSCPAFLRPSALLLYTEYHRADNVSREKIKKIKKEYRRWNVERREGMDMDGFAGLA